MISSSPTKTVHGFAHLAGGAMEHYYTPPRQVVPKSGSLPLDRFLQNKDSWVKKIKVAFMHVSVLPPEAQWGVDETADNTMTENLIKAISTLDTWENADEKVSAASELHFTACSRLQLNGGGNHMPNSSTFCGTKERFWTPEERIDGVIFGLRSCKTLAVNVLSG